MSFGLTDTCNQASKPMTKENTVYCVLQKILVSIISFEFAIGVEIINGTNNHISAPFLGDSQILDTKVMS